MSSMTEVEPKSSAIFGPSLISGNKFIADIDASGFNAVHAALSSDIFLK